jgi:threonine dehydrogenase-like Zn-dependent dehydrogenase
MKAASWMGKQQIEVRDVPDPRILNERDAIVRITSTAICGSDLHLYNGFVQPMKKGDVLGHEFMGEVVEVGPAVAKLAVGDRVVVPFTIACGACWQCRHENWSLCENTNPNAALPEKAMGHAASGAFGYSHLTGGFAGGQAAYARVPFADVGPLKMESGLTDEQVLLLSRHPAHGLHGRRDVRHPARRHGRRLGLRPRRPVRDQVRVPARARKGDRARPLRLPPRHGAAEGGGGDGQLRGRRSVTETLIEMTAGRGPDACIDAVGMEAHGSGLEYAYDRTKQALMLETDRPTALRQVIRACRNGGTISVLGVYGGLIDKFPMGKVMNRSLTIRSGQCHVHRYMRPLLDRIVKGEIDPTMVITHRLPLADAADAYEMFLKKEDNCEKVVLQP